MNLSSPWTASAHFYPLFHVCSRRRQWHPTPVLLPGESQEWGSLVGCRLWGSQSRTRLKQLSSSSRSVFALCFLIRPHSPISKFLSSALEPSHSSHYAENTADSLLLVGGLNSPLSGRQTQGETQPHRSHLHSSSGPLQNQSPLVRHCQHLYQQPLFIYSF